MEIVDPTALHKTDYHTIVAHYGRRGEPHIFAGILRRMLWVNPRSESRFAVRIVKTTNDVDCVIVVDKDLNKVFAIIPGKTLAAVLNVNGEIDSLEADPSSPGFVILPGLDV